MGDSTYVQTGLALPPTWSSPWCSEQSSGWWSVFYGIFMELYVVNLNECPFFWEFVLSKFGGFKYPLFHEMVLICFCILIVALAQEKFGNFISAPKIFLGKCIEYEIQIPASHSLSSRYLLKTSVAVILAPKTLVRLSLIFPSPPF